MYLAFTTGSRLFILRSKTAVFSLCRHSDWFFLDPDALGRRVISFSLSVSFVFFLYATELFGLFFFVCVWFYLPCALGWATKALNGWPCPGWGGCCCCWKASGGTWRKLFGPPPPPGESCPPTRLNCGFDEKAAGEGGGGGSGTGFWFCLCWRKRLDSENGLLSPPNRLGKRRPPPPPTVWSWHWLPSNRMSLTVAANSSRAICERQSTRYERIIGRGHVKAVQTA